MDGTWFPMLMFFFSFLRGKNQHKFWNGLANKFQFPCLMIHLTCKVVETFFWWNAFSTLHPFNVNFNGREMVDGLKKSLDRLIDDIVCFVEHYTPFWRIFKSNTFYYKQYYTRTHIRSFRLIVNSLMPYSNVNNFKYLPIPRLTTLKTKMGFISHYPKAVRCGNSNSELLKSIQISVQLAAYLWNMAT